MGYRRFGGKKIYLFAAALGLSLFLCSLNNPGKVLAYSYANNSCGVDGTIHDYAGLAVGFGVSSDSDTPNGYGSVTVRVNTAYPSYQNQNNSNNASGNGYYNLVNNSDGSLMNGATFYAVPKNNICGVGSNYMVILGNRNPTADTNNKEWQLDCDFSIRAESGGPKYNTSTPYQEFGIFPSGTPDGLRGGGFWTVDSGSYNANGDTADTANTGHIGPSNTQRIGPGNGGTGTIVFIYHEPAAPPPHQPSSTTPACTAFSYSGGTVTIGTNSYRLYAGIDLSGATIDSATITNHVSANDEWYVNPGTGTAVDGSSWTPDDNPAVTRPASDFISSTSDGTLVKSMTANLIPNAQYVSETINEYYWDGSSWVYHDQISSTSSQCYQSGCSVQSITGDLPGGYIKNGGTVTVTANVPNYSADYLTQGIYVYPAIPQTDGAGNSLVIHTNKGDSGAFSVPATANGSTQVTFTFTAPSTGATDSFSGGVEYNNGDFWVSGSTDCSGSYDIYQPPVPTVTAACQSSISGSVTDTYYPSAGIPVNIYADGAAGAGTRVDDGTLATDGNGNYSLAMPSAYQDGKNHKFYAYAIDLYGIENGGPATYAMTGCGTFKLAPGANGAKLSPTFENPTSFNGKATVNVTYGSGVSWPATFPGVGIGTPGVSNPYYVSYTFTKNGGSPIQSGSVPGPNSDGYFLNQTWPPTAYTIASGSYTIGDKYCINVSATPIAGYVQNDGTILSVTTNGPDTQTNCDMVHNEPYVHVLGGDAEAGDGFGVNCTPSTSGGIHTYINSTGSRPGGSGTQFGAQALDIIEGFGSANLRSLAPTGPMDLTFANNGGVVGSPPGPTMGGKVGLSGYCLPEYYPTSTAGMTDPGSPLSGTIANQAYSHSSGNLTIGSTNPISNSTNAAVYVTGHDVYIKSNITYAGSGSWGNVSDIPSFMLVVKGGNIYIDPGVTQLDGIYVAEPSGANTGAINTCGNGFASYTLQNIADNCKNQLIVNGALVADKIFLSRSYSSLRYSQRGEYYVSAGPVRSCGNAGTDVPTGDPGSSDCAAEVFNISPELFMSKWQQLPNTGPTTGKFDYITSLSPVL